MHQHTAGLNSPNFSNRELKTIFDRHYRALVYFASQIVNNSSSAEEIVNDTFLKLSLKQPGDFAQEQLLKAFLYITTRNACFNLLRDTKTHALDDNQLIQLYHTEEAMEQTEIINRIKEEIDALSADMKQVMDLVLEGKQQAEIAELLGLGVEKVKALRRKAIGVLRLKLLDKGIPLLYLYLLVREN